MMKSFLLLFVCSLAFGATGWKGDKIIASGVSLQGASIEVTADDQVIQVGDKSAIVLSSDSAVGNQRNILLTEPTLANPNDVHTLYLMFEDVASDKINLVDNVAISGGSGVVKLGGLWNPNHGDVLCLVYFAPDWRECGRSNN